MYFTIHGAPFGKQRPKFGHGRAYTPKQTVEYEKAVAEACLKAMQEQDQLQIEASQPIGVHVDAYYQIPKSWSKRKQERAAMGLEAPTVKPDADNVLKIILDGCQGIAFEDDKQVIKSNIDKKYSTEPRVDVTIYTIHFGNN